MQVRYYAGALVAIIALSTFALPVEAQVGNPLFPRTDRSTIEMCPKDTRPAETAGTKEWDNPGVSPLLPEILGSGPEVLHMFFAYDLTPEWLNSTEIEILSRLAPKDLENLMVGRKAVQQAMALYLFTPLGTPRDQAPLQPPDSFRKKVSRMMQPENLKRDVITCWSTLNGVSFGTRKIGQNGVIGAIETSVHSDALLAAWFVKGVTKDGLPGFPIWRAMDADGRALTVLIEEGEGHNAGNVVSIYDIIFCGNVGFDIRPPFTEPVTVTAAPPPPPPPASSAPLTDAAKTIPVVTPPTETASKSDEVEGGGGFWVPCWRGKHNKWACAALVGLGIYLGTKDGSSPPQALPPPPPVIKTSGPGCRDVGCQ